MPQVGGDPIVESGSNADGDFTRFSDGTLIFVINDLDYNSAVARRDYSPPSAFIISKNIAAGSVTAAGTLTTAQTNAISSLAIVWSGSLGGEIRIFSNTVNSFTGVIYVSITARWK
jgi:hypothetical protein